MSRPSRSEAFIFSVAVPLSPARGVVTAALRGAGALNHQLINILIRFMTAFTDYNSEYFNHVWFLTGLKPDSNVG